MCANSIFVRVKNLQLYFIAGSGKWWWCCIVCTMQVNIGVLFCEPVLIVVKENVISGYYYRLQGHSGASVWCVIDVPFGVALIFWSK